MANPERGEVALTIGDQTFTLVSDFDARCQVEALLSTPDEKMPYWRAFGLAVLQLSDTHARAVLWGALRRHHKDISVQRAGELIDAMGGTEQFLLTLSKLKKASEPETYARPPRARQTTAKIRTGARTSSTRGGSGSPPTSSGG